MIRAIRVELIRPLGEEWETVGIVLYTLSKATPKLLNSALEARIACGIVGTSVVKENLAPGVKAKSADGIVYQAVLLAADNLRAWGIKNKHPFAELEVSGAMSSVIGRCASQAYSRRDQERPPVGTVRRRSRGWRWLGFRLASLPVGRRNRKKKET